MSNALVHRSFWVIDALEENSLKALQDSLINAANTLCLCTEPLVEFRTGLCAISRPPSSRDAQLRVLQDVSKLCLKSFHQAVGKLKPCAAHSDPDQYKLATVLKSIVDLVSRPEKSANGNDFQHQRRSIYIVAQDVRFGKHLKRVLQMDPSIEVHFSVFPCNFAADPPPNEASPESCLVEFASGVADLENVTFTICPCDPLGFEQAALLWVRDLLANNHQEVDLMIPQMESFLDRDKIMCMYTEHKISLDTSFRATPTCPCHGEPLEDQSNAPVEFGSVFPHPVGISDARCSITRAPLRRQDCGLDNRIIRVGSTTLRLPSFSNYSDLLESTKTWETSVGMHRPILHAIATIPFDQIPETCLTGEPHTLFPNLAAQDATNDCILSSLCSLLNDQAQVLLVQGRQDLDSNIAKASLPMHYIARPSEKAGMLVGSMMEKFMASYTGLVVLVLIEWEMQAQGGKGAVEGKRGEDRSQEVENGDTGEEPDMT
ncbi:hypothetical protein BSKO_07841 [Bryopsis sp. KO-2023]|nr:hypothetical protein BSKO_07841 [Bryopsis sp. KO-2023]